MGSSKKSTTSSQQQQQQSQTQPYAPTIPLLGQDVSAVQSLFPNYQPTGAENTALSGLASNATSFPSFAQPATNITSSFLGGDPSGLLRPALNAYNSAINPIATASLDPTQNPAIASALDTVRNDVTNSVNGMFAGAGRDLSGANTQTLARGISQGEAPILLSQYNQNVANTQNAAGGLLGAAGSTASAMGGNQGQGFNFSSALPSIINQPQLQQLAAAAAARGLPIQNLAQLEALTLPIAGLGSQSSGTASGTGQSTTTSSPSLFSMLTAPLSGSGSSSAIGAGLSFLLSDRRLKTDIVRIGKLNDGTLVYRFRYLNDKTVRIGLMADEVDPDAVFELNGIKLVDYDKATQRAMEMSHGAF